MKAKGPAPAKAQECEMAMCAYARLGGECRLL